MFIPLSTFPTQIKACFLKIFAYKCKGVCNYKVKKQTTRD